MMIKNIKAILFDMLTQEIFEKVLEGIIFR